VSSPPSLSPPAGADPLAAESAFVIDGDIEFGVAIDIEGPSER
jgi:hypothetical protein